MNRICPSEEVLSEYLEGLLSEEDKLSIENHLCRCPECRSLIIDACHITSKPSASEIVNKVLTWTRSNKWLIASAVSFICSFLVPEYFLQFIAAFVILSIKWVLDSKSAKTLIMIEGSSKAISKNKSKLKK